MKSNKKYVAVLDRHSGMFYLSNIKEVIIEDDTGMCLISLPDGSRLYCRQSRTFDDVLKGYEFIYQLNRL